MILDANDPAAGTVLQPDLCIVGAGAAGISIALQFIGTGIQVLLLESGSLEPEADTQALYSGSVVEERLHSPPDRYRQRRFGGSTTIWGGRCMPFDAIDFEPRDYVPGSGWPIGLEALLPFYPEANRLCEAGDFLYTAEETFGTGSRPMIQDFDSPLFSSNTLERFSRPTDFGARYGARLRAATNVTVLLHANVTAIRLAPGGTRVTALDVQTLAGRKLKALARQFVLAPVDSRCRACYW